MITIKDQEDLLIEISRKLTKKMNVIAIGGTAMMFLGYKSSTVDIDLVFNDHTDRTEFAIATQLLGYEYISSVPVYGTGENQPIMLKRLDHRFDLFLRDVIRITFSNEMMNRVKETHEFGNLVLKIADPHDIIIMKCATGRPKDIEDIISIIDKVKINWDIIIEESKNQVKLGRERAVFDLLGTLNELKKIKGKNIKIPEEVFEKIWSDCKK